MIAVDSSKRRVDLPQQVARQRDAVGCEFLALNIACHIGKMDRRPSSAFDALAGEGVALQRFYVI